MLSLLCDRWKSLSSHATGKHVCVECCHCCVIGGNHCLVMLLTNKSVECCHCCVIGGNHCLVMLLTIKCVLNVVIVV